MDMNIKRPTLIVDKKKVVKNIKRVIKKIKSSPGEVRFRPHFKTHQSAEVGEWFRDLGVDSIAVSSVEMAEYFYQQGWENITIAVVVNTLQMDEINRLAENIQLNLLVDSKRMVQILSKQLKHPVHVWIKIDTGYHRTGIEWGYRDHILNTAQAIEKSKKLTLAGLFTHSGHSYDAPTHEMIKSVYNDTVIKMQYIRDFLAQNGSPGVEISIGDTPGCSVMDSYNGIDEVRHGNFVYYDLMQLKLGACREEDIAAAVACPGIASYPQRKEIVVYGGAVHLSKEAVEIAQKQLFGMVAVHDESTGTWDKSLPDTVVKSLSQEHGIIGTSLPYIQQIKIGDLLMVLPVHACLAANLLKDHTHIV
jgi:D-serine deaminase-like pyridoxal phosphate-dependent protein